MNIVPHAVGCVVVRGRIVGRSTACRVRPRRRPMSCLALPVDCPLRPIGSVRNRPPVNSAGVIPPLARTLALATSHDRAAHAKDRDDGIGARGRDRQGHAKLAILRRLVCRRRLSQLHPMCGPGKGFAGMQVHERGISVRNIANQLGNVILPTTINYGWACGTLKRNRYPSHMDGSASDGRASLPSTPSHIAPSIEGKAGSRCESIEALVVRTRMPSNAATVRSRTERM